MWPKTLDLSLRQEHRAGEKLFLDYAGQSLWLTDPQTGTRTPVALFVAVLGASNYTYAEATRTADLPAWIGSHVHAFAYFGGVPAALIPDNHKSAVLHPDRYEPDLHPTYLDLATHYGATILPTRVRRPRDKAKVETAVLIVSMGRQSLACGDRQFFSPSDNFSPSVKGADHAARFAGREAIATMWLTGLLFLMSYDGPRF